jgi:hypothetical protein
MPTSRVAAGAAAGADFGCMAGSSLQSWDTETDDAGARFVVLDDFDGAAVLDRETQLIWQRAHGRGGCAGLAGPSTRALRP